MIRFSVVMTITCIACGSAPGDTDAGALAALDAGAVADAGGVDAGAVADAGGLDAGAVADAGGVDAGGVDAGGVDAGGVDAGGVDAGGVDAGVDAGVSIVVLADVTLDSGVTYQLLRLIRPGHAAAYAQWFPPDARDGGPRPVVVLTQPYDGIDWTQEAVDLRWAAGGDGLRPDVDGPAFDGGDIVYTALSQYAAADNAFVWRFHNFGVLLLYGRFYAGGDVQNDIDDMTVGFDFLAHTPFVDRTRIGILGGSWGGFEALYGAAYARADVRPTVGVALYPLSDFAAEKTYVTQTLPARYSLQASRDACATFFDPYLRRLNATTARTGFAGLTAADLVPRITAPFLLVHEDWDTLVSFEQSQHLVALSSQFEPLWLLHAAPPSPWDQVVNKHGLLLETYGSGAIYTSVWSYLLTRLGDAKQQLWVPWEAAKFRALVSMVHDRQLEGKDVRFFAARLLELTDPRIFMYELNTKAVVPGIDMVTSEVNTVWGRSYSAGTIRQVLDAGLPAP